MDQFLKPDLLAPGNGVASLWAVNGTIDTTHTATRVLTNYDLTNGTTAAGVYSRLSGTSMATPVVSGTVAAMIHRSSTLTPDVVKARLMKTASKSLANAGTNVTAQGSWEILNDAFRVGAGYLDANAAINNSDTAAGEAYSVPTYWDAATASVELWIEPSLDIWAANSFTPTSVWGTSALLNSTTVWKPATAVWSTPSTGAYNVISGDNLIWVDNVIWGDADWAQSLANGDK